MTNRIYAYTVVGKDTETWERGNGEDRVTGTGLVKVGQTTRRTAKERIRQQLGTAYPDLDGVSILLDEKAVRPDGSTFTDTELHDLMVSAGVRRVRGEWFEATVEEVQAACASLRTGENFELGRFATFRMRPEQHDAVERTVAYFQDHAGDSGPRKFLWNAKMRFGKTFTAYQVARKMRWTRVLVLTYKPAVASAWRDDLLSHTDFTGWQFIDRDTPDDERDRLADDPAPLVCFASFQDLGGRTQDGEIKQHNETIHLIDWDCIILDEYHFGAWRQGARELYDPTDSRAAEDEEPDERVTEQDLGLSAAHYLYLSGTPFRALTEGEFTEDQIYNWTYLDEQAAKHAWDPEDGENPYRALPGMSVYAYEMGDNAEEWAEDGEFNAFSLNEFFAARRVNPSSTAIGPGSFEFVDPDRVQDFLAMLRGQMSDQMKSQVVAGQRPPFPYDGGVFRDAVRHSVWYLPDVGACYAMANMLADHPFYSGYEIVTAAGARAGQGPAALPPVEAAIGSCTKHQKSGTITLTCGKLMAGVTIPEWGAILMLRSLQSPETYFQAAFRVQSPHAHRDAAGTLEVLKEHCYVFEFDPNRALSLVAQYGTRLASTGDVTPSEAIKQLLDYLPIFGFSGGQMSQLDADELLDWATVGVGATALAQRWNSPLLVEVNEHTLGAVLEQPGLLETLEQIEDFRALAQHGEHVVTSTKELKKAKREQGGKLDQGQRKQQNETAKRRKEIREKLQKFLAHIPVFMYATDFREEALKDVIQSLDPALFERVTGLKVEDFQLLNDLGLFNASHMNMAIYQFKMFETASLHYADEDGKYDPSGRRIGLWEQSVPETNVY